MRIPFLFFLHLLCCTANAQPFHARDFILSAGSGAGTTQFTVRDTAGYHSSDDGSGINYCLRGELGLSTWLSTDFTVSATPLIFTPAGNAHCFILDAGPGISYHVPWKNNRIDLAGGVGINYTWYLNATGLGINPDERFDAAGVGFSGDVHPRFYFTQKQRFGALLYYRFNSYFLKAEYSEDAVVLQRLNMQGQSHTFGLGLFYRFAKRTPDLTPQ